MSLRAYEEPEFPENAGHKIILMAGASASGKTTWRNNFLRYHEGENWRVINGDEIRIQYIMENGIGYNESHQQPHTRIIAQRFDDALRSAVKDGANIIIDAINARREGRRDLMQRIKTYSEEYHPDSTHYYDEAALVGFLISEEESLERNQARDAHRRERGWPSLDIPKERIEKFIRELTEELPLPGGPEPFTQYVYHISEGFRARYPTIATAVDASLERHARQAELGG